MKKHISKRKEQVEYEPDLYHLYVSCLWQALYHRYEHTGQHQHDHQVHSKGRFKEEGFEVVSDVANNVEEDSGCVDSGYGAQQLSAQPNINYNKALDINLSL
jgi:hypothetical protein